MRTFNSNYDMKAGDWFKILSLEPSDKYTTNRESYEGKIFEYYGDGYALPVDNRMNLKYFKKGFTFTQTDL